MSNFVVAEIKCPKCDSTMIEGLVADRTQETHIKQIWVKGKPEESLFFGLKTSNREAYFVQAFRCANCSYLEFYTTEKVSI